MKVIKSGNNSVTSEGQHLVANFKFSSPTSHVVIKLQFDSLYHGPAHSALDGD